MDDAGLETIASHAADGARLREAFFFSCKEKLREAAFQAAIRLARGGKILFCGNGGSAADAQHMAAEFVNRFLIDRPALPAIALTTDASVLTAIGNDIDFSQVFARQVEALGGKDDLLFAISTSGNSENVLEALNVARDAEMFCVGLTGRGGGKMGALCSILLAVPDSRTPLVQETHLAAEHLFCQLVDYYLFENVAALAPYLASQPENED